MSFLVERLAISVCENTCKSTHESALSNMYILLCFFLFTAAVMGMKQERKVPIERKCEAAVEEEEELRNKPSHRFISQQLYVIFRTSSYYPFAIFTLHPHPPHPSIPLIIINIVILASAKASSIRNNNSKIISFFSFTCWLLLFDIILCCIHNIISHTNANEWRKMDPRPEGEK